MNPLAERLVESAEDAALSLDAAAAETLTRYVAELLEENQRVNLTAAKDAEEACEILVLPSLAVQRAWDGAAPPERILDLGTGNGFPGVAAAVSWPEARVVLVERRQKKARAVAACVAAAGLENIDVLACDARELKNEHPETLGSQDLVTVRAVGSLASATRLSAPLLAPGGRLAQWKSVHLEAGERSEGERVAAGLGLTVHVDVHHSDGAARLVVYERPGSAA